MADTQNYLYLSEAYREILLTLVQERTDSETQDLIVRIFIFGPQADINFDAIQPGIIKADGNSSNIADFTITGDERIIAATAHMCAGVAIRSVCENLADGVPCKGFRDLKRELRTWVEQHFATLSQKLNLIEFNQEGIGRLAARIQREQELIRDLPISEQYEGLDRVRKLVEEAIATCGPKADPKRIDFAIRNQNDGLGVNRSNLYQVLREKTNAGEYKGYKPRKPKK
jgi:hypothetical protein